MKKYFKNLAFIFISLFAVGIINVSATTVTVETEEELKAAVDGQKVVDGVTVDDTDTTEVKLMADITLTSYLSIIPITDLTLDLNGHTIDGETNSKSVGFTYGSNNIATFNEGSLTIKDSSSGKLGAIKSYDTIDLKGNNYNNVNKHFALTIEGGKFYVINDSIMFSLSYNNYYMKNTIFDFQVKDGYFETTGNYAMLLFTDNTVANNVTLNVNYEKLTFKNSSLQPRLIYLDKDVTVNDIVSSDSNIKLKNSVRNTEGILTDRTLSAKSWNAFGGVIGDYNIIEITKKDGFDVSDVTLNATYGYETLPEGVITIKNVSESNSLQVETVSVSSTDFEIIGATEPTLAAGATDNTSFKVKAKSNLTAGEHTATITVTGKNGKTYTATVKLIVARKTFDDLSVSLADWTYGDTVIPSYTKGGADSVSSTQYKIEYTKSDVISWSEVKPTKAGTYKIRLTLTDPNLEEKSVESTFTIAKNTKEIQIIANSQEFTYDGNNHSNNGYVVKYDGAVCENGVLPTGDKVVAVVSGSIKDVKNNLIGNNVVASYTITDSDGGDSKDSYLTKTTSAGTIKINPISTPIIVTADSETRAYNEETLTKNTYTYTTDVLVAGDRLTATITGEQKYVGQSDNVVSDVKVMRGSEDITSNYSFGTHVKGTLKITPIDQPLSIADQYVRVNATLTTSELEAALTGAKGNVSFSVNTPGSGGEYNDELYGGFKAGNTVADVSMTITAQEYDENGDGIAEYNLTTKNDLIIHVVNKTTVTISGITNNQEFTYNGSSKTPTGTITVTDNKVAVSDLEVSYAGVGSTTYSSTTAPTNAGTYKVTYKVPNSNANYVGEATFNFTIKKAQLSKVTLIEDSFEYTGEDIVIEIPNNWNASLMEATGDFEKTNVGNYTIIVSLKESIKKNYEWNDGTTSDLTLNWSITKADPSYDIPTNLTGLKGQTLNDITLTGRFTWNNASTPLIVGTHTYTATYTPSDTANYNVIDNIEITVVTKDIFNVTTSVDGGNGTITESFINVVEDSVKEIIFTPNTGFMIDKVLVNGVSTSVTNNKLSLTVDGNKTVVVSYKKIPFTITVEDTTGAVISPNGIVNVSYGDDKDFNISAASGYRLIKVLVNDIDKTTNLNSGVLTIENITENKTIKVVVEKIVYEVIEGDNQEYTITKDSKATFRIDASYEKFSDGGKVYVDDILVDSKNYTSESGSTIITLKQSYVDTLSIGVHGLKVVFNDGGEARAAFKVAKVDTPVSEEETNTNTSTDNKDNTTDNLNKPVKDNENNPKTGDHIVTYVVLGLVSLVGVLGTSIVLIKGKRNN